MIMKSKGTQGGMFCEHQIFHGREIFYRRADSMYTYSCKQIAKSNDIKIYHGKK